MLLRLSSTAATLLRVLFGFDAKDKDKRALQLVWDTIEGTRELLVSGGFLVDFFPILRFAPSVIPFQRKFARWRAVNMHFKNELFARYKMELVCNHLLSYPRPPSTP